MNFQEQNNLKMFTTLTQLVKILITGAYYNNYCNYAFLIFLIGISTTYDGPSINFLKIFKKQIFFSTH